MEGKCQICGGQGVIPGVKIDPGPGDLESHSIFITVVRPVYFSVYMNVNL